MNNDKKADIKNSHETAGKACLQENVGGLRLQRDTQRTCSQPDNILKGVVVKKVSATEDSADITIYQERERQQL